MFRACLYGYGLTCQLHTRYQVEVGLNVKSVSMMYEVAHLSLGPGRSPKMDNFSQNLKYRSNFYLKSSKLI